jgi:hypothetical protein
MCCVELISEIRNGFFKRSVKLNKAIYLSVVMFECEMEDRLNAVSKSKNPILNVSQVHGSVSVE